VAGVALGVACAWPLVTSVIPDALGWWLEFDVEPSRLAFVLGAVAVASLLAGLYPAWLARGVAAREVFAPE
jgi:ABC-type lipoprotein release transport system permease subunit